MLRYSWIYLITVFIVNKNLISSLQLVSLRNSYYIKPENFKALALNNPALLPVLAVEEESTLDPFSQVKEKLAIFYLKNELKLSEDTLNRLILKYSWLMYLRVDTNLRPTVGVLKSFGFRDKDVRK